jgi:hypothetical protein
MHFQLKFNKKNQIMNSFNLTKIKTRLFKLILFRVLTILEILQFNLLKMRINNWNVAKGQNKHFAKNMFKKSLNRLMNR